MAKRMVRSILIFIVSIGMVQTLFSQEVGDRAHEGFFMRFLVGGGTGGIVIEDVDGSDMEIKGTPLGGRFQIGASVSPNLIVFGEVGGFNLGEPTITWKGEEGALSGKQMLINDFGVGVTYYVMPANIFFALSLTAALDKISTENDDGTLETEADTDSGFGVNVSVGKEWWIGRKWALGGALFLHYSNPKDPSPGGPYQVKNFIVGIACSISYD